jgi:hypothetical protein
MQFLRRNWYYIGSVIFVALAVSAQIRRQPGHQSLQGGVDRNSGAIIVVST